MFIDRAKITIKAGDGGDGMTSFLRLKGIAKGGPDGGDGGNGGNIVFEGDNSISSLLDFKYRTKYHAENGERGGAKKCYGKSGADLIIKVPLGTVIKDVGSGSIIADIFYDGEKRIVLKGGEGGKGNVKFATSRRQAPNFSQRGERQEARQVMLELKTIADVGLIGFPNVGKSTLLSQISAARPKIASYHFTTLSPNLGVVSYRDFNFTAADIPGLIEGAADGLGLGHDFLRHIERTRMLIHIVDISGIEGREPFDDYLKINAELTKYSQALGSAVQIIAANKCDLPQAAENLKIFKEKIGDKKVIEISAITGKGKEELIKEVMRTLKNLPPAQPIRHDEFEFEEKEPYEFEVQFSDGDYYVTGNIVKTLTRNVVLDQPDSLAYFHKIMRDKGVIKALKKQGANDGDAVIIGDVEFEFLE